MKKPIEGGVHNEQPTALQEAVEPFSVYLSMLEAHCECAELGTLEDKDTILHFMGSGASHRVTVKQLRNLVALLGRPPQEVDAALLQPIGVPHPDCERCNG